MTDRVPFTRTEKILLTALAVSVLIAVLIPSVFFLAQQQKDREDAKALEGRRIEACLSHNQDQQRAREWAVEDKRQMGRVFYHLTDTEIDALADEFADFAAAAARSFPYRTCTPACVVAEYEPGAAKCGPSKTVEGT